MPRKPSAKQIQKQNEARIERVYRQRCNGIQIPIMETVKVWQVGERAIAEGADDQELGDKIAAYVATIRTN